MKYRYTWNHILLLARVCGEADDADNLTASWVQITEEHNRQTFPFTLWPLTYRTCEVTTSPAMCSPVHISIPDLACDYDAKIFKCNEVVIICIQKHSRGSVCEHACIADLDVVVDEEGEEEGEEEEEDEEEEEEAVAGVFKNHADHHLSSTDVPLLPCHVAHCYHRVKGAIKDAYYAIEDGGTECVICTGHGAGASMASCLASDMSRAYDAEMDFLGLDTRRVEVDFVGFSDKLSDCVVASPAYWDEHGLCIGAYISVVLELEGCGTAATTKPKKSSANLICNPRSSLVTLAASPSLGKSPSTSLSRSMSVFQNLRRKTSKKDKKSSPHREEPACGIPEYISAIKTKIEIGLPGYNT